jgi:hypothetical protein
MYTDMTNRSLPCTTQARFWGAASDAAFDGQDCSEDDTEEEDDHHDNKKRSTTGGRKKVQVRGQDALVPV